MADTQTIQAGLDLATRTHELARAAKERLVLPDISERTPAVPLASRIDHTLLKPDASAGDIESACQEAIARGFATVCVHPCRLAQAAELLQGSPVLPIAVVGFPLGATTATTKAFEARECVRLGAREIDMVLNIGALIDGDYELVLSEIREVVRAAAPYPVKVILETSLLTDERKVIASALAQGAGAAFVKTSTGFAAGGATPYDVALLRETVGPKMGVKASGGIRSRADAEKMIAAGADRIGTSAGAAIVSGEPARASGY